MNTEWNDEIAKLRARQAEIDAQQQWGDDLAKWGKRQQSAGWQFTQIAFAVCSLLFLLMWLTA